MNRLSIIFALFLFLGFNSAFAQSETKDEKKENKKMEKNHDKMDHKMSDESAAAKPWNEVCPVRGNKVQEGTVTVSHKGKEYGFCCPGCDSKFENNPEKYSKNLSENGKKFIGKN